MHVDDAAVVPVPRGVAQEELRVDESSRAELLRLQRVHFAVGQIDDGVARKVRVSIRLAMCSRSVRRWSLLIQRNSSQFKR